MSLKNKKHYEEVDCESCYVYKEEDVREEMLKILKDIYNNGIGCCCEKCVQRRMNKIFGKEKK